MVSLVRTKLNDTYQPTRLEIIDNSHLHAGHRGNVLGGSHLAVTLCSAVFTGMSTIQRFRHVQATLKDELAGAIHALELNLSTPD
jgi:BolA protein